MSFNRDAYLMHYNHNHDKLGRFTTAIGSAGGKVGSSVLSSGKKKKAPPKADIKRRKVVKAIIPNYQNQTERESLILVQRRKFLRIKTSCQTENLKLL